MAKTISSLNVVLGMVTAPFVSGIGMAKSAIIGFTSSVTSAGGTLVKLTGVAGLVGGAFAALKGAASGITLAAELEQTQVAFETMLGSADQAKAMMQSLTDFAASTPFEFPEIARSAKQLLAFGVTAGEMTNKLKMLGDISAGIGKPLNELAAIYGKIKSRGQLTGETLNQLAEAGVPIYKALAKEMGVTESQVAGMVTAGKIGFAQVDSALGKLTASGGQFSGMMEKQSKTLAGLWSTLTDNIGLTLAGLVTTIVDAFHLREALAAFTGFVGTVGGKINSLVSMYAPVIVGFMSSIYSTIVSYASAIYGYVAPIVADIYAVIAANWQTIVSTTVGYLTALYGVISSVLSAAWSLVSSIWNGITAVWAWGCDLIGYQTQQASTTSGTAVQGIVDVWQWAVSTITEVLNVASFAISHFADIVAYAGTASSYYVVKLYNVIEHYVLAAVEYVKWFGSNFVSLLVDAFNLGNTITENGVRNVAAIIANLPGLIAGTTSLSDIWTPLTQGFEATASALPTIAERIPGDLEAALDAQSKEMGDGLVDGLIDHLNQADKQSKSVANAIGSTIAGIGDKFAGVKPPDIKTPTLSTTPVTQAADAMDDLKKKTDKASQSWEALASNSQQALATHAAGAFATAVEQSSKSTAKPSTAAAAASTAVTSAAKPLTPQQQTITLVDPKVTTPVMPSVIPAVMPLVGTPQASPVTPFNAPAQPQAVEPQAVPMSQEARKAVTDAKSTKDDSKQLTELVTVAKAIIDYLRANGVAILES